MGNVSARACFAHAKEVLSTPFLPCDITYAISEPCYPKPRGSKIARAEGLGTRFPHSRLRTLPAPTFGPMLARERITPRPNRNIRCQSLCIFIYAQIYQLGWYAKYAH